METKYLKNNINTSKLDDDALLGVDFLVVREEVVDHEGDLAVERKHVERGEHVAAQLALEAFGEHKEVTGLLDAGEVLALLLGRVVDAQEIVADLLELVVHGAAVALALVDGGALCPQRGRQVAVEDRECRRDDLHV